MPAGFFVRGFTVFWWFGGEVRDFAADGFCQVEGGVVQVELSIGFPEVQDVALGLAVGVEAAEDLALEVGGKVSPGSRRRFVQRAGAAMLLPLDGDSAKLLQHFQEWNPFSQRGIIDGSPRRAGRGVGCRRD